MFNNDIKFSLWCDFLERDFINSKFPKLIDKEIISGATTNPSIFKSAICSSKAYLDIKNSYKRKSPKKIYEILATLDIKMAASMLLKNYANFNDGFVSIEVDPNLHDNPKASYEEGKRLFNIIKMPNTMIKIPATKYSYGAMSDLIKKGINVNATLVFSIDQVSECLEAFKEGTELYKKRFPNCVLPTGIISIFVSRFDRFLDEELEKNGLQTSKFGVYNATKLYKMIETRGLPNVRALFASTGVKGNELQKDYYIKELFYPNAINTAPLETIEAFVKQNYVQKELPNDTEIAKFFDDIKKANINYEKLCKKLLDDGLEAFCIAFEDILQSLKT